MATPEKWSRNDMLPTVSLLTVVGVLAVVVVAFNSGHPLFGVFGGIGVLCGGIVLAALLSE